MSEDEYDYEKKDEQVKDLPSGVQERLEKHAERTGDKIGEVIAHYLGFILNEHGCDNWQVEDEDLLIDWAEQCFVQLRRGTGGGSDHVGNYYAKIGSSYDAAHEDTKSKTIEQVLFDHVRWSPTIVAESE